MGLMVSSNVPYKLASDKAFFDTWVPHETEDVLAKARLAAGNNIVLKILIRVVW